jgi:AcrR family transcriptional regulator
VAKRIDPDTIVRKARLNRARTRSRQDIVEAAILLFSERGYNATTIRDIAKSVGMLPGSLYAHMDDKEGLLVEIVERGIDSFLAAVEPIVKLADPPDVRLRKAVKAHIEVIADNLQQTLVVFHQWRYLTLERQASIVQKRDRYEQQFLRVIREGMEQGVFPRQLDPHVATLSVLGMLNWVPEWYSADGPYTANELGERLATFILSGLLEPARRPDASQSK